MGKKTPKIAPSSWDCTTLMEEVRATVIGNMHKKFGKHCACGSGDMLVDRQTDRHTHTYRHTNRHTDELITILRHKSRGQSKKFQIFHKVE